MNNIETPVFPLYFVGEKSLIQLGPNVFYIPNVCFYLSLKCFNHLKNNYTNPQKTLPINNTQVFTIKVIAEPIKTNKIETINRVLLPISLDLNTRKIYIRIAEIGTIEFAIVK